MDTDVIELLELLFIIRHTGVYRQKGSDWVIEAALRKACRLFLRHHVTTLSDPEHN